MSGRIRRRKPNAHGRSAGRFVQIGHSVIDSAAFRHLSSNAVKLLIAIWRRHNGYNNGQIAFSIREAMNLLGCGTSQATAAFKDLERQGFIVCERQSSFNTKARRAREWRLTTEACIGQPATRDFLKRTLKQRTVPGAGTDSAQSGNREPEKLSPDTGKKAPAVPGPGTVGRLHGAQSGNTYISPCTTSRTAQPGASRISGTIDRSPASLSGKRIAEMRNTRGMGQAQLAENIGISRSYLATIEQGRRPLSRALFERVVDVLVEDPLVRSHLTAKGRRP